MRKFEFHLTITGEGDTLEEAWRDAVESFTLDPGAYPDPAQHLVTEVDKDAS